MRALIISNIAWDFVWQRHQSLATLLSRDYEVIFCEVPGVRQVRLGDVPRVLGRLRQLVRNPFAVAKGAWPLDGIRIVRPWVLPATNAAFCAVNARLVDRFLARESNLRDGVDLILNYSPARTALQLLNRVPHRRLVYDCTDDWLAVRGIPAFLGSDEQSLLRRADLTVVPSRALFDRKQPWARRLEKLPHGAFVERFLADPRHRHADEPVTLLYYGHLHRQHLDFVLLDGLARRRPDWHIILVGPVKTSHAFPANVEMPGQQPHAELRDFIARADVLLLPYVLNRYTEAVLPAKTFECLATGRPIVASPLPELVENFSTHFRFATGLDGWLGEIEAALTRESVEARTARVEYARVNTWDVRYVQLRAWLAQLEERRV